jgi:hypothetical protein
MTGCSVWGARVIPLLALLALGLTGSPGVAQQEARVAVGDRVRIRTEDEVFLGVLRRTGDGLIEIEEGNRAESTSLPLASVVRIEVHRGTHSAWKRGAIGGLIGGVLLGAIHGSTTSLCNHCSGSAAGVEMIGFGVLGTVGGAVTGAFFSVDHWERVPLPPPPMATVGGNGGPRRGLAFAVGRN